MVTSHSFPFLLATPILAALFTILSCSHHCFISCGVSRCDKNGMIIYSLHLFLSRSMILVTICTAPFLLEFLHPSSQSY
ncbi:hypothetical protein BD769DRAFT_1421023 [Suillus cothurnatus]|nr:hypothetical protein BD769DRAFT_1421023 [Suillus cothurnatus]